MHATRDTWRSNHRLVRQLNTLRKHYESRLPSRGFSLLDHADQATVLLAFPDVDPLLLPVEHRLRCFRGGFGYRVGTRSRLPR